MRLLGPDATGLGLGGRRLSPFVGRDPELNLLLDRLRQVRRSGHGHAVAIMGEPGAGKSRLLFELRQSLADHGIQCLEGRCASHALTTPYGMLLDLVRRAWRLDEDETAAGLAAVIQERLVTLGLAPTDAPYLLLLFGLPAEALTHLSPEALKTRTFEILRRLVIAHGRQAPTVLLLEDLHWADRTSAEFLGTLVDTLPGSPLFVIATTRPGDHAPWLDRSWASQLSLPPLSRSDGHAIAHTILSDGPSAEAVIARIVARADGNPFFLEELAWAVAGQVDVADPSAVPHTVIDALTARMDRLTAEARGLLEIAAVLGREVPLGLLEALTALPGGTLGALMRQLIAAEFLHEQPGPTFIFKHALTQQVAYARLAPPECQRLHEAAGRAIESSHANRLDEVLGLLAFHWARTNYHVRATDYLERLARRATRTYALAEAVDALFEAIRHAERVTPETSRETVVLGLLSLFGLPLVLLGRVREARDLLLAYRERMDRLGVSTIAGPYYFWLAHIYNHLADETSAAAYAHRALEHASRCQDALTLGQAHYELSIESFWKGQCREGADHARMAIAMLEPEGSLFWLGLARWSLGWHLTILGEFDEAKAEGARTCRVGESAGDRRIQSYGLSNIGWTASIRGETLEAIGTCRRALDLAPDPLCSAVVMHFLAHAELEAGDITVASATFERVAESFNQFGMQQMRAWALAWLGETAVLSRQDAKAESVAAAALATGQELGFAYVVGLAHRVLGRTALARGEVTQARHRLQTAFEVFTRIEASHEVARTLQDLARVASAASDTATAHEDLAAARQRFISLDAPRWVERTEALATELGIMLDRH